MTKAYVALGANLGNPQEALQAALEDLRQTAGVGVTAVSSFYRTAPVESSGPDYVNAVAEVATTLAASELLHVLQRIENAHGRVRPVGVVNAPRTLDLDLLLFGKDTVATPELAVPHPRMHLRAFVLVPLLEIAPDAVIPGLGAARDYVAATADQAIQKI